jgi:hypothetical protein
MNFYPLRILSTSNICIEISSRARKLSNVNAEFRVNEARKKLLKFAFPSSTYRYILKDLVPHVLTKL